MSTIVLRSVKGTPLTNTEVDSNFSNLNTDKIEIGGTYSSGTANGVLFLNSSKVLTTGSALTFDGTTFTNTGNTVLGDASTYTVTVNGYMGVGGSANGAYNIIASGASTAGPNQYSVGSNATLSGTTFAASFLAGHTIAASITSSNSAGVRVINTVLGSGAVITSQHGLHIADLTSGTNNYGITSLVSSGTNKWNIYASGTAANYMAGQLQLGDGSAAAPALSNFGDENTGIFFPAADTIAFAEGGAEAMRITSAGKLLVGDSSAPSISASFMGGGGSAASIAALGSATTPIQISSFSGTAGYAGYLAFTRGKGTDSSDASVPVADGNRLGSMVFFGADGTDFTSDAAYITATVDGTVATGSVPGALSFFTNAAGSSTPTERMRINSSGNVGIGTSSPVGNLDVAGTAPTLNIRDTQSKTWVAGDTVGTLDFYSNDTSGVGAQAVSRIRSVADAASAAPSGALAFWTAAAGAAATEKLRITSSGNVGIGSSSPAGKLEVNVGSSAAWFTRVAGDVGVSNAAIGLLTTATTGQIRSYGDMLFYTTTVGGSISEKMRLDASGNVGIGTSSPAYKLDVLRSGNGIGARIGNGTTSTFFYNDASLSYIASESSIINGLAISNSSNYVSVITGPAGTEKARFDSSGNLGLGVTPSAWNSDYKSVAVSNFAEFYGRVATPAVGVAYNAFRNSGGSWIYKTTNAAARYEQDSGFHIWSTAPSGTAGNAISFTQAMSLTAAGELLVGTTSALVAGLGMRMVVDTGSSSDGIGVIVNPSGTPQAMRFAYGSTAVGSIILSPSATSYNTSSDYRLKENIAPMTGALAKVAALKPVTYTWKADGSAGEGFIAHELAEVCPAAVTGEKDAVDADGKPQYQGIDVSFLVGTLTAAIQELKAEFDAYKASHP